jgi:hypothetical protein
MDNAVLLKGNRVRVGSQLKVDRASIRPCPMQMRMIRT